MEARLIGPVILPLNFPVKFFAEVHRLYLLGGFTFAFASLLLLGNMSVLLPVHHTQIHDAIADQVLMISIHSYLQK